MQLVQHTIGRYRKSQSEICKHQYYNTSITFKGRQKNNDYQIVPYSKIENQKLNETQFKKKTQQLSQHLLFTNSPNVLNALLCLQRNSFKISLVYIHWPFRQSLVKLLDIVTDLYLPVLTDDIPKDFFYAEETMI